MGLRHLVHLGVIIFVNYQESVVIIFVLSAVLEVHPLRSECRVCSLTWPSFSKPVLCDSPKPNHEAPGQHTDASIFPFGLSPAHIKEKSPSHLWCVTKICKFRIYFRLSYLLFSYMRATWAHADSISERSDENWQNVLKLKFGHENFGNEDQLRPAVTWLQSLPTPLCNTSF